MADHSSIEWTQATWNPTTGCDRTSPGCDNCYAQTLAKRLKAMGVAKYQRDGDPRTSGPGFGVSVHRDSLGIPRRWRNPRTIFVNSMSDLFHPEVSAQFIAQVFEVICDTPQHTYQVLTKRSRRLKEMSSNLPWPDNLWMGVTVESRQYRFRLDHLRCVPASVRFGSFEPLLGPLPQLDLSGIHWAIVGGESGHGHRPIEENWVFEIRDQCVDNDVAFFFKQWGGATSKSHGRLLEGRTWDAMPAVPRVRRLHTLDAPGQGPKGS